MTDNQVKILSDLAELAGSIDVGRARAALAAAEAALPPGEEGKGTEAEAAVSGPGPSGHRRGPEA